MCRKARTKVDRESASGASRRNEPAKSHEEEFNEHLVVKSHRMLLTATRLLNLIDTVRIKGQVLLDLTHRFVWGFVGPYCVERTIAAGWNAVIGGIALVRAVRCVLAAHECVHIDVAARKVLNRGIVGLVKRQCVATVGDNLAADRNGDPRRVRFD